MAPNVGLGTTGSMQRGWGLWLTSVLAVVIAAIFVGARLAQRFVKRSGLGMDDYMIIAALVSSALLSLTECQAVVYGYGRHWASLDHQSRVVARKWFYGANIVYKVVLMFNKISVVCLYYRIFAISTKYFRVACYAMITWVVVSSMAFIVATVFQCTPIAAFWDIGIPGFQCFKNEPWWISYATVQITTDIMLLAMPVRQILQLSMSKAEKFGICLVFGTGAFVTFASIYRATTIAASASDPDPTWGPIPATIWSVIEANAGIVCACLPMLRGPFVRLFGPVFGSRRTASQRQTYPLTWRSGQPNSVAVMGNSGRAGSDAVSELDRDSEEGITKEDGFATASDHKGFALKRRASQIMVTNEFSVVSNDYARRKSMAGSEGVETGTVSSAHDEKADGKKPFSHI